MSDIDPIATAREALAAAYTVLVPAFDRIHCLPRTQDTVLARKIGEVRRQIAEALAALSVAPAGEAGTAADALVVPVREWIEERWPSDEAEKRLMATFVLLYPNEFGKDDCSCGEQATCDACQTQAEIIAWAKGILAQETSNG